MLIKTVSDIENKVLADMEYDEAFVGALSDEIKEYYIHTVYVHDYESSGDSGDGRDDYYKEEEDLPINLSNCIVKDNKFYGVICECFERQAIVSLDSPEAVIYHPKNYGGRNYHYYREKQFKLAKASKK